MGYHETVCQLCGVSFAIARLRRADEPESAAWDHLGANYIGEEPEYEDEKEEDIINRTCGGTRNSGCYLLNRLPDHSDSSPSKEHISGPGCASTRGYSGHRISLEEMKGCRTVQCLVKKEEGWQAEKGDEKWEVESAYFLSGYGEGRSLKGGSLSNIRPRRHGIDSLYCGNVPSRHPEDEVVNGDEDGLGIVCLTYYDDDERKGIPFHPSCFEIFKRVSLHQTRKIDVHGLWSWHSVSTPSSPPRYISSPLPKKMAVNPSSPHIAPSIRILPHHFSPSPSRPNRQTPILEPQTRQRIPHRQSPAHTYT